MSENSSLRVECSRSGPYLPFLFLHPSLPSVLILLSNWHFTQVDLSVEVISSS